MDIFVLLNLFIFRWAELLQNISTYSTATEFSNKAEINDHNFLQAKTTLDSREKKSRFKRKRSNTRAHRFITSELVICELWGWFWTRPSLTSSILPAAFHTLTWKNKADSVPAGWSSWWWCRSGSGQHATVSNMWHIQRRIVPDWKTDWCCLVVECHSHPHI